MNQSTRVIPSYESTELPCIYKCSQGSHPYDLTMGSSVAVDCELTACIVFPVLNSSGRAIILHFLDCRLVAQENEIEADLGAGVDAAAPWPHQFDSWDDNSGSHFQGTGSPLGEIGAVFFGSPFTLQVAFDYGASESATFDVFDCARGK